MTAQVVEAVTAATLAELKRRERGETPDRRFDPLLDVVRDFADELVRWQEPVGEDPLADDEIEVTVVNEQAGLHAGYRATARHVPTGLSAEARAWSARAARADARDALLGLLEIAGGC